MCPSTTSATRWGDSTFSALYRFINEFSTPKRRRSVNQELNDVEAWWKRLKAQRFCDEVARREDVLCWNGVDRGTVHAKVNITKFA